MTFKKILKDNQPVLLAAFVLSTALLLFFPISVYQKNKGIIGFSLSDMWYILLGLTVAGFIVSAAIGVLVGQYLFKYIGVIYLAVVLCFWVQGNFLTYDLGVLDGREIDWSAFQNYYYVEAFLWIGGIAAAVWFRKRIQKDLTFLLIVVALLQVSPLVITGFEQASVDEKKPSIYFNTEKEFEFSSEKNVVIIVVDTARSDAFEQVLARNPKYQKTFKDFTFFKNTAGGYPITKASIPLILSGKYYDNSVSFKQYIQSTLSNSLPALLKRNGYIVEQYSFVPTYVDIWDNAIYSVSCEDANKFAKKLYLVMFLRYFPLPFKSRIVEFYYEGDNYSGKDMVDLYNNATKTSKVDKSPIFKFVHLTGTHPPFQLDRFLKFTDDGNYLDEMESSLMAVDRLLGEMKETGVYDNSLILVMGDHGSTEPWEIPQELQESSTMLMLNGVPMLLAKKFNQTQTILKTSDQPVTIADIPKTVMDMLQIQNDLPGISIFTDVADSNRIRIFYFYDHLQQVIDFLPPLYKFEVSGHVRSPGSWRFLGEIYDSVKSKSTLPQYYQYGDNIVSYSNHYMSFFSYGFREEPRRLGAWAIGRHSCIYLPIQATTEPVSLFLSVTPFLEKTLIPTQQLDISMNGQIVESIQLKTTNWTHLTVYPSLDNLTSDNQIKLCLNFSDAKYSPKDMGINKDVVVYGGFFESIVINKNKPFLIPVEFNFSKKGNATIIQGDGWSDPEFEFTWTMGQHATLLIPLEVPPSGDRLQLTVSAMPFVVNEKLSDQLIIVRSNGLELDRWDIRQRGEYTVSIPSGNIVNGLLKLEFDIPNATSPASVSAGADTRILGIAVHWLRIEIQDPN